MTSVTPGLENLAQFQKLQFKSAMAHCATCRTYHAVWPYLRASGAVGGIEADEPFLSPILEELLSRGARDILLAGSADSGVTALVHRALLKQGYAARLTVLDRCLTPLQTCREYAQTQAIDLTTIQADLAAIPLRTEMDLIIGHSVLPFILEDERRGVLSQMASALKPGGHVLLTVRVAPENPNKTVRRRLPEEMAQFVTDGLARHSIELPCPKPVFHSLISDFYLHRSYHVYRFTDTNTLKNDLESVGLNVVNVHPLGHGSMDTINAENRPMGWAYVAKRRIA